MEINEFKQCLDHIINNNNENIQLECRRAILNLRIENTVLFFNHVFQIFNDSNSSLSQIVLCLSAIRDMLNQTEDFPLLRIIQNWFSDFMNEIRPNLKNYIFYFIHNQEFAIKNISASIYALIFAIELFQPNDEYVYWKQIFTNFVNEFISDEVPDYSKQGIMTFFHEIMTFPEFSKMQKEIDFILPHLQLFLHKLINNLMYPDSNSKICFDFSILCILDLVTYAPVIFDEEQRRMLLSSYSECLSKTDPNQFQQLFEIYFKIIVNFYDKASQYMDKIFEYTIKGIICPNDELVSISIEFWIQLCIFEESKESKSQQFTKTAMNQIVKILLNVISQNNIQTGKQAIILIRHFAQLYNQEMIDMSIPIINENIFNNENMVGVFVSLALLQGICTERSDAYSILCNFFGHICFIIENFGIVNENEQNEMIGPIPYAAIWAANSSIRVCEKIANDKRTFGFVLSLLQNNNIHKNLIYSVFQLASRLFKSSKHAILATFADGFYEILFESLDDQSKMIDIDCLDSNFTALLDLIDNTPLRCSILVNLFPKVFDKLEKYNDFLESYDKKFVEFRLIGILKVVDSFINKLEDKFQPFCQIVIESLIHCDKLHRDIAFESILVILSSMCIHLKSKFNENSAFTIDFIRNGLRAESPSIINRSMILCSDFIVYVNHDNTELIVEMFDLLDNLPPYHAYMVIPTFVKAFASMYWLLDDFIWPIEVIDKFFINVDAQLKSPFLSYNSNKFDPDYAMRIYESCFKAYAAFFSRAKITVSNKEKAIQLLKVNALQCCNTKAYNCDTVFALFQFCSVLANKYMQDITPHIFKKWVLNILKNEKILKKMSIQYRKSIEEGLNEMKIIKGNVKYEKEEDV